MLIVCLLYTKDFGSLSDLLYVIFSHKNTVQLCYYVFADEAFQKQGAKVVSGAQQVS